MSISWGGMTWVNQPRKWHWDGPDLHVRTDYGSDFWRVTAQGYERDSGHAFLAREKGDVAVEITVRGTYAAQHDQAGVMLRLGDRQWVKAGVQLVDDVLWASVVTTREVSDWSMVRLDGLAGDDPVRFRLSRTGDAAEVRCSADGGPWRRLRLAYFPARVPVGIGPMCSSPNRAGLEAWFADCEIETSGPTWEWLGR